MAKGGTSKDKIIDALKAALPEHWVGVDDKKRAVFEFVEDGEPIQVAVALSCPKTFIPRQGTPSPTITTPSSDAGAFVTAEAAAKEKEKLEISDEERKNVDTLLTNLGIDLSKF